MSSMCRSWACGWSSSRPAESTDGAYTEVDVVGQPKGFIRARARARRRQPSTHRCSRARCRSSCTATSTCSHAGRRRSRSRPTRRTPAARSATTAAACASASRPSARSDEFFERLADAGLQPPRLSQARLRRALRRASWASPATPPRPSLKTQQRLARLLDAEYVFSRRVGRRRRRPRPSTTCSPTAPPTRTGGSRSTSTRRLDGEYTYQHFKGRLPYHLHTRTRTIAAPSARTASRARPTATCAGPGSGRSRANADGGTHVRFDWRVHADRRLLKLLTPFLRPALRCEPQLGDRPRDRRARALRADHAKVS